MAEQLLLQGPPLLRASFASLKPGQRRSPSSVSLPLALPRSVEKRRPRRKMVVAVAAGVSPGLVDVKPLLGDDQAVYGSVQEYYGKVLSTSKDLKTDACCTKAAPPKVIRDILRKVPEEVVSKYYGCGSPLPLGIEGMRVLDLGSGSGRDCYIASALVGPSGSVTGVDMTAEQLAVAKKHVDDYTNQLGYPKPNLRFVEGHIEFLDRAGIADESVDLVISNCVVNLSPDKERVLREVYRVLAPGGEFYFSDVYCDRRLPETVQKHEVLFGECLAGALYVEDFKRICQRVGFADPRVLSSSSIEVLDKELLGVVGEAKFKSITYRLFKLPGRLETLCEDYGQVAYYKGTIEGHPHAYQLDDHHRFEKDRPVLVCGNSASMVGESWLKKHFWIVGDRSTHFGLFPCGPAPASAPGEGGASCC